VTFKGLERHVFEDDRRQASDHPFNHPRYHGASILIVGRNFGSGSSREHAPEGLRRWGIRGLVGESFAEIFIGNCIALGLPCLTLAPEDVIRLMETVAGNPEQEIVLNVEHRVVKFGDRTIPARLADAHHHQLVTGTWNATGALLEAGEAIDRVAKRLPYISGY
jgi:3-isopropylmalate/(R)-2-methylmalate dehydratase small subunit